MVHLSEEIFLTQRRKGAKKTLLETRQRFAPLRPFREKSSYEYFCAKALSEHVYERG
jgi:hypothetical protein